MLARSKSKRLYDADEPTEIDAELSEAHQLIARFSRHLDRAFSDVMLEDVRRGGLCNSILSMLDDGQEVTGDFLRWLREEVSNQRGAPIWYRHFCRATYYLGCAAYYQSLPGDDPGIWSCIQKGEVALRQFVRARYGVDAKRYAAVLT